MPEILLPTKATQDAIKADTTKLLQSSGVVKSVQRGSLKQDGTFDTEMVSIEKVNANKSVVITTNVGAFAMMGSDYYEANTGHASLSSDGMYLYVKSPSRYSSYAGRPSGLQNDIVYWQVVEFY